MHAKKSLFFTKIEWMVALVKKHFGLPHETATLAGSRKIWRKDSAAARSPLPSPYSRVKIADGANKHRHYMAGTRVILSS
jgi:hypothetical protein